MQTRETMYLHIYNAGTQYTSVANCLHFTLPLAHTIQNVIFNVYRMGQLKFHYNLIEYHPLLIDGIFCFRIVLTRVSTDSCIHPFVHLHVAININTLSSAFPKIIQ